jgi:hypothetical protein
MNDKQKNYEPLARLALRAGRLSRLIKGDVPTILIRSEALLILSAAMDLDGGREGQRMLADSAGEHVLTQLRNDSIEECVQMVCNFTDSAPPADAELLRDVAEVLSEAKTPLPPRPQLVVVSDALEAAIRTTLGES